MQDQSCAQDMAFMILPLDVRNMIYDILFSDLVFECHGATALRAHKHDIPILALITTSLPIKDEILNAVASRATFQIRSSRHISVNLPTTLGATRAALISHLQLFYLPLRRGFYKSMINLDRRLVQTFSSLPKFSLLDVAKMTCHRLRQYDIIIPGDYGPLAPLSIYPAGTWNSRHLSSSLRKRRLMAISARGEIDEANLMDGLSPPSYSGRLQLKQVESLGINLLHTVFKGSCHGLDPDEEISTLLHGARRQGIRLQIAFTCHLEWRVEERGVYGPPERCGLVSHAHIFVRLFPSHSCFCRLHVQVFDYHPAL